MTVNEFIKNFKLPQKLLAERIEMNYGTFRKKINESDNKFTEEEAARLTVAVHEYIKELHENVQKYLEIVA